jgi:hypothetical protein
MVDHLQNHNILIIDWCCMCKSSGESVVHLLRHCTMVSDIWSFVFSLFGVSWVMPKTTVQLLSC